MQPYQSYTHDIQHGTPGNGMAAFFDLDGTIIASHSVKDLFMERLLSGQVSSKEALGMVSMSIQYALKAEDFEDIMSASIANMKGESEKHFVELGHKVFRERLSPAIFPEMRAIIEAHQEKGHQVVIITSATSFQVDPIAEYLGVDHVICTRLKTRKGKYTGELDGRACYGENKRIAAEEFAAEHGVDLDQSYFYSNGSEDLPLLEAVGNPVAVCPDKSLHETAAWNGWPVHQLTSRGSTGVKDAARTLGTFTSVLPSFLLGLPFRLMGQQQESINFSVSMWGQIASLISGLKLIVEGEEHLWSHRPAVFIFNHQSAIDTVIIARLIQRDMVSIAKKEIKKQPIMGPAMAFAGTVFIDRENVQDPKAVLQPAVDALHAGKSVVMAPEGTRSKDEKLGAFKPGAFHLAKQAGVPIVPIVIHNALDALPNKSMVVHPAEVKVTVLKPITTKNWNRRSVYKNCRQVRQAYLDILGQK